MDRNYAIPEPVSNLKSHLGFWMRFVSNHVSHAFAAKLLASGVSVAEWVVLREMYGRDDTSPSSIADFTGVTRGAVSKLVDRLVERKLVLRIDRTDDRRYQDIRLTASGNRLVPALGVLADSNDQEFFAALSKSERATLLAILKKLAQANNLQKLPTE
jgi:DNA-binding MarR family transcriptional regulator